MNKQLEIPLDEQRDAGPTFDEWFRSLPVAPGCEAIVREELASRGEDEGGAT